MENDQLLRQYLVRKRSAYLTTSSGGGGVSGGGPVLVRPAAAQRTFSQPLAAAAAAALSVCPYHSAIGHTAGIKAAPVVKRASVRETAQSPCVR